MEFQQVWKKEEDFVGVNLIKSLQRKLNKIKLRKRDSHKDMVCQSSWSKSMHEIRMEYSYMIQI